MAYYIITSRTFALDYIVTYRYCGDSEQIYARSFAYFCANVECGVANQTLYTLYHFRFKWTAEWQRRNDKFLIILLPIS